MNPFSRSSSKAVLFSGLVLWSLASLSPAPAQARRGVVVFNTGEEVFPTGDLPAPFDQDPELDRWQAGYKCEVFGVFWAYAWWWNCTPVAFAEDSFIDEPELVSVLEEKYSEGDMQMGVWGRYGRWLLFPFLLLALYGIYLQITGQDDDDDEINDDEEPESRTSTG